MCRGLKFKRELRIPYSSLERLDSVEPPHHVQYRLLSQDERLCLNKSIRDDWVAAAVTHGHHRISQEPPLKLPLATLLMYHHDALYPCKDGCFPSRGVCAWGLFIYYLLVVAGVLLCL